MGMFDTIKFLDPRWPDLVGRSFQTKSLHCELSNYTITESGRLVHHYVEWEPTPEEKKPHPHATDWRAARGCIRAKAGSERDIDRNWHGDVYMYDDQTKRDIVARFTDGLLVSITKEGAADATH